MSGRKALMSQAHQDKQASAQGISPGIPNSHVKAGMAARWSGQPGPPCWSCSAVGEGRRDEDEEDAEWRPGCAEGCV